MVDVNDDNVLFHKQIVRGKFHFLIVKEKPKRTNGCHFFSFSQESIYNPFFEDFGPPSLGKIYRFCTLVEKKLRLAGDKTIYFYSDHSPEHRTNAVFLVGAYCILERGQLPQCVYEGFKELDEKNYLVGYRDAAAGEATHRLKLLDCFTALHRAAKLKLIQLSNFDLKEYEHWEQVENGDLNWLIPGKVLAFCSPVDNTKTKNLEDDGGDYYSHTPGHYLPYFTEHSVVSVVRLNFNEYDRNVFLRAGIDHHDMYFVDGTQPPRPILQKFIDITEKAVARGAIAVHCKAGLGRTGTLVGCYMMKHYGFNAREIIAFLRVMRPGSVIGPQQHFLEGWERTDLLKMRAASVELDHVHRYIEFYSNEVNDVSMSDESTVVTEDVEVSPRKSRRSKAASASAEPIESPSRAALAVPVQPRKIRKSAASSSSGSSSDSVNADVSGLHDKTNHLHTPHVKASSPLDKRRSSVRAR